MDFKERVLKALLDIPYGRVATYGDLAEHIGCTGGARAVGNALHGNTDADMYPCYRVVNSKGRLAMKYGLGGWEVQAAYLRQEGVEVAGMTVDLEKYRFRFDENAEAEESEKTE